MLGYQSFFNNKRLIEKNFRTVSFAKKRNENIAQEMLASDAVVLHIRRGDIIAVNRADLNYGYSKTLADVYALNSPTKKKLFVFSDDISFVKEHPKQYGIDIFGEDVVYVTGNNYYASLDDFMLMMLGKVIITGGSGFSLFAALCSQRVDCVYTRADLLPDMNGCWERRKEA
jgi:hypothetical protein